MSAHKATNIIKAICGNLWAIRPDKLEAIVGVVDGWAAGVKIDAEDVERKIGAASRTSSRAAGGVAVLPLFGTIAQRMNLMAAYSGGTSTEQFKRDFDAAMADSEVSGIVIDTDSPGGTVYGVDELAKHIYQARGTKRIVAFANAQMASAAYYIASAADEIWVTPSGEVGSIGVMAVHFDHSKENEAMGITPTYVHAGQHKVEGHPDAPLDDEARAELQKAVNEYYGMFVNSVARNRGTTANRVEKNFGQGRMFRATEAVERGLADKVGTLPQVVRAAAKTPAVKTLVERERLGL